MAVFLTLCCRALIGRTVTMLVHVVTYSHTMISLLLFGFCFWIGDYGWIELAFQVSDGLNSVHVVRTRTLRASFHWRRHDPRVFNSGSSFHPPYIENGVFRFNFFTSLPLTFLSPLLYYFLRVYTPHICTYIIRLSLGALMKIYATFNIFLKLYNSNSPYVITPTCALNLKHVTVLSLYTAIFCV